ncbi:cysteine methyltransferase, partial [Dietzia sp. Marseille-Q0999]|nr:cysteine methyltransferase [Dietzia massiliensis]
MTEHATTDPAIATLRAAPADTGRLRDRLACDAEREGLVDVFYRTVYSPIGGLLLAATPVGLVYVAFEVEDADAVLATLATRIGPRVLRAEGDSPVLDEAAAQIGQYLAGD